MSLLAELRPADLISPQYLALQKELHARPTSYGERGYKHAAAVTELVARFDAGSVLDYGCGEGTLIERLKQSGLRGVRFSEYDPAIAAKAHRPSFADLVVCTDVLEHVEPDKLNTVLQHLRTLARRAVFLVVSTREASRTLADGRNAHLIIEQADWWQARVVAAGFTLHPAPTPSPLAKPSREWMTVLTP